MIDHDTSPVCGQVGHEILVTLTVRCRHTEAVWTTTQQWTDDGTDDQKVKISTRHDFGPFDSPEDIQELVEDVHGDALRVLLAR